MMIRMKIGALSAAFLIGVALSAQQTAVLEVGKPVQRDISAGQTHVHLLTLRTGEFARGTIEQRGMPVNLIAHFPDGTKLRSFNDPASSSRTFRFVAEAAGAYQLEIVPVPPAGSGTYRLEIQQIQSMSERLAIAPEESFHSPRLVALRKEIESGNRTALAAFWQDVERQGTPLTEPIPGDDRNLLTTFLWRATFETYNVVVLWAPYAFEHPDDFSMRRLLDTDLWYKTLRIPKGARFLYQLSPNDTLSRAPNAQRFATAQLDPYNPRRRPDNPNLSRYGVFSVAELPGAKPQRWSQARTDVERGSIQRHRFASARLRNERDISVYTPPGYRNSGSRFPLVVLFDEMTYLTDVPSPVILDNLIAAKKIPPPSQFS
jgi:Enterochelin esterase, N-terminal